MAILNEAISLYRRKDFYKALQLFEQAGDKYGKHLVETNIRLCHKALGVSSKKNNTAPLISGKLDAATRLMLANAGKLTLIEAEKSELLTEYRKAVAKKSEDATVKPVNPIPSDWPKDLVLSPLPESTNDFLWNRRRKELIGSPQNTAKEIGLSIIIPTFNRSRILDVTLACLCNQQTTYPFEVIVADDGSKEKIEDIIREYESLLDIKYTRQKDYGYQLCAVRNLGLRAAKYDFVSILDCDMAPNPYWVQSYVELLQEDDDVALIGPRKYVDTSAHSPASFMSNSNLIETLPEVVTNNQVTGKTEKSKSVDWRLAHFEKTDNLRLCNSPFRYFSGGNVAFAKKWFHRAGWFDEEFNHWGGEDNEFGYRLYRAGCYFRAVNGAMAFHQEPPGKENETDRAAGKVITIQLVQEKVPYFYRKLEPIETARIKTAPLVSIYIPAYNCADSIVRCVDSALNQTVTDLEVCICDDGSTDNTLEVLQEHYGQHPRVRFISQKNGGIGAASNSAVKLCRGFYIGQLDSDDFLEPDAVELCLNEFKKNLELVCVYTTNRNLDSNGELIANGYNWPVYSREKLTTAMICHHFRMFTARSWNLTSGFDEKITNAVDYDMYLKLSEVGQFKHINKIAYNRVLHGENTSIKKLGIQKLNHYKVVNASLSRLGVEQYKYEPQNVDDKHCRKYIFMNTSVDQSFSKKNPDYKNLDKPIVGVVNFSTLIKRNAGSFISSRELDWETHVSKILNPDRLDIRTKFLLDVILPNLQKQVEVDGRTNFRFCILISNILPLEYKERLTQSKNKYPWLILEERGEDDYLDATGAIKRALISLNIKNDDTFEFSSFRQDDDDFLSNIYLKKIDGYVTKENIGKFITFSQGYRGVWNEQCTKILNMVKVSKPFTLSGLAHIGSFSPKNQQFTTNPGTVFAGVSHYELSKLFQVMDDREPEMFFWSQHGSQDTIGRFKSSEITSSWEKPTSEAIQSMRKFPELNKFL